MKKQKINNTYSGYTIIETMIAISLFLVIAVSGMGALLNANLLYKKSQDTRSIMDSLNFIMEDMSRNLRVGYNYYCISGSDTMSNVSTPKAGSSCWGIAMETATGSTSNQNDQWVYAIDSATGKLFKSTAGPYITANFVQVTPDEVSISSVSSFSVMGAPSSATDTAQPFIVIKLVGNITTKGVATPFSLQTAVSQRLLDI